MKVLRLILGDQLTRSISALQGLNPAQDVVLMAEVRQENTYARHHQQKIALVLSAMRHFAAALREEGVPLEYVKLEEEGNSGSIFGEVQRALNRLAMDCVIVTEPGEWRVWEQMQTWQVRLGVPVEIRPDDRFLCSREEFKQWAGGYKNPRMELFYRAMRRKTGWLMDGDQPLGGRWNFDPLNRKSIPRGLPLPTWQRHEPDQITRKVLDLVERQFGDHFGQLRPFGWGVTRQQALQALEDFIRERLPWFGDYQDAMQSGEDLLFHSALSPYINIGLLSPREVCQAALNAYHAGEVPLASVEGFIRQISGWREFTRGIYWLHMPAYAQSNYLQARRPLPAFYWNADTAMNCLRQTILSTRRNAYAHHIQRLMLTGNFALLAGIDPAQVEEWYLIVYADAFEWVELPNTHGMALYADGGIMGSKPYAASGAYIRRMSNYCGACKFDPNEKIGSRACPFNTLYWNFIHENRERLQTNPRMAVIYRALDRMDAHTRQQIFKQARDFLDNLI